MEHGGSVEIRNICHCFVSFSSFGWDERKNHDIQRIPIVYTNHKPDHKESRDVKNYLYNNTV